MEKSFNIPINIEGMDEINAKIEKINALMCEIKTLAESITQATVTVSLPDDN